MGGIAFLFSGQGDQFPGMGKELYDRYPAAAEVFDLCEELRPGTLRQCFWGSEEELKETMNTQPCLFAYELAAAAVLRERGVSPGALAGFSLGEVAAAAFSGLVDLTTGFTLVCRRGLLMQREAERFDTSMAAVLKLGPEPVRELCAAHGGVYAVNFNCPGQVSVSGLTGQMPSFFADVKKAGGRVVPLKVRGAFHSPFMKNAAEDFAEILARTDFRTPGIPLYSDMTAGLYGSDPARLLSGQICSPVLWEQTVRNMRAAGLDTFIEIGPGRTLTNMMKKIDPEAAAYTVTEYLEEVLPC